MGTVIRRTIEIVCSHAFIVTSSRIIVFVSVVCGKIYPINGSKIILRNTNGL